MANYQGMTHYPQEPFPPAAAAVTSYFGDVLRGKPPDLPGGIYDIRRQLEAGDLGGAAEAFTPGGGFAASMGAALRTGAKGVREVLLPSGKTVTTDAPKAAPSRQTVNDPHTRAFPEIYLDPAELVSRARVAPEDPIMEQLWGTTRSDLYDIAQQGTRQGNITERPFTAALRAKGAKHAPQVMTRRNENRIANIIEEARGRPDLFEGMAAWYTMDPVYQRLVELVGPREAELRYRNLNAFTAMASPNSEVLTELNRGTAANWLANEGQFDLFEEFGGVPYHKRGAGFPEALRAVPGHMVHSTAQAGPMRRFAESGELQMGSAKVPSYYHASGVPETGFQTQWPVGDAHWSRLVGLPDVRGLVRDKNTGLYVPNAASASVPEMVALGPWWRDRVAARTGLESVPAQAVVWGAGSNATGVTSPIAAPKLELFSQQIQKTADRLGISPEDARDMVLLARTHAGQADPTLLAGLGAGGAGIAATPFLINALRGGEDE